MVNAVMLSAFLSFTSVKGGALGSAPDPNYSLHSLPDSRAMHSLVAVSRKPLRANVRKNRVIVHHWSLSGDFDPAFYQNGPWTYGLYAKGTTPATFTHYLWFWRSFRGLNLLVLALRDNQDDLHINPNIIKNPSGNNISYREILWPPNQMSVSPGIYGEVATVRFTAPADGEYHFTKILFNALDHGAKGTTTQAQVWINGALYQQGNVNKATTFGNQNGDFVLSLKAGNTVDFSVTDGGDGYQSDATGLALEIDLVK